MIRLPLLAVAVLATLGLAGSAQALPTFGMKCNTCHTATTGRQAIVGTATLNLDGKRLDKALVGAKKVFTVARGATVSIPVDVLNGSSKYAVSFACRKNVGLVSALTHHMAYKVNTAWIATGGYYVTTTRSTPWSGVKTRYTVKLTIGATTPPDTYEAFIVTAGVAGGQWCQTGRFYIVVK